MNMFTHGRTNHSFETLKFINALILNVHAPTWAWVRVSRSQGLRPGPREQRDHNTGVTN